jgi:hypothetical protein
MYYYAHFNYHRTSSDDKLEAHVHTQPTIQILTRTLKCASLPRWTKLTFELEIKLNMVC